MRFPRIVLALLTLGPGLLALALASPATPYRTLRYVEGDRMKALQVLMLLAAFSLAVPGWALAQGMNAAPVPTQSVILPQAPVLPQGQELSEEELNAVEGGIPYALVYWGGRALVGAIFGAVDEYLGTGEVTWDGIRRGAIAGIASGFLTKWFPARR